MTELRPARREDVTRYGGKLTAHAQQAVARQTGDQGADHAFLVQGTPRCGHDLTQSQSKHFGKDSETRRGAGGSQCAHSPAVYR